MKNVYLALAIVGAAVPYVFFIDFMLAEGAGLGGFIAAWTADGATRGLTADVVIASLAFWAWMFSRPGGPKPWLFVALNLLIGLSCALPAYLFARERRKSGSH